MTWWRATLTGVICAMAPAAAMADIDILSVTFNCENNTVIPVSYFNSTDGSGAAAMVVDGQLIAMRQAQSGSGILYESQGTEGTYKLRSKGWDAIITHQADGATAPERILFKDCTSR